MDTKAFTIEINEKFTRVVDLKYEKNMFELLALGYKETVPYFFSTENDQILEKEAESIAELVSHLRIRKKNVNVIIPDTYTFSQIIEMPQLKEKELLAAIRYQADEFIPMPIEDTVLDIEILSENPKTRKLLLFIVACPKKVVQQVQKTLEKAHLLPENMENELSATGRLIGEIFKKGTKPVGTASIIVNLGYTQSSLYLLDNTTGLITMLRTFKVGLELFAREIKINLNIDDQAAFDSMRAQTPDKLKNVISIISPGIKEFIQEVERFVFLSRDHNNLTVSNIYLFNFEIFCPMLLSGMKSHFTMPVESLQLGAALAKNSISSSFATSISSFISIIGGSIE